MELRQKTQQLPITVYLKNLATNNLDQTPFTALELPAPTMLEELAPDPDNQNFPDLRPLASKAIDLLNEGITLLQNSLTNSKASQSVTIKFIDYPQLAMNLFLPISAIDQFIERNILPIIELPITYAHDRILRTNLITLAQDCYQHILIKSKLLLNETQTKKLTCQQHYLLMLKALVFKDKIALREYREALKTQVKNDYRNQHDFSTTEKAYAQFINQYIYQPLKNTNLDSTEEINDVAIKIKRSIETIGKTFGNLDPAMSKLSAHISRWVFDPIGELSKAAIKKIIKAINRSFQKNAHITSKCLEALCSARKTHQPSSYHLSYLNDHNIEQWATELATNLPTIPLRLSIFSTIQKIIQNMVYSPTEKLALACYQDCHNRLEAKFNSVIAKPATTESTNIITHCKGSYYRLSAQAVTPKEKIRITQEQNSMERAEGLNQSINDANAGKSGYDFNRLAST